MGLLSPRSPVSMHPSSVLAPIVLLASAVSGAPYEVTEVTPLPEKLVQGGHHHHEKSVQCRTEYQVIWDTEYQEQAYQTCETVYEQKCEVRSERLCHNTTREECHLVQDQVCKTIYNKVCRDEYKTVLEPFTETECVTKYQDDCEFHWEVTPSGEKVWAVIPGSCKKNPVDECHDVQKTHSKQVAHQVCEQVPEKQCQYVNRQECYQVPDKVCKSEPITQCSEVPKQICKVHHKRVPVRVSKNVPKKVCHVPSHAVHTVPIHTVHTIPSHTVHNVHEFVPVPAPAPAPVLPVLSVTTPSALDDILNRNENNIEFGGENTVDQVAQASDNVDELDRFVFEESESTNNSTINFE